MNLNFIIGRLGKPYYENEYGVIYNMDCVEGLEKLKGLKLDSTITSPPYNIGKEYEEIIGLDKYISWLSQIGHLVYEATKNDGSFFLNLGYLDVQNKGRAVPIPYLLWDKMKFYLHQEIIWNYGAGVGAKNYLSPRNEKVLWYIKDKKNYTFNLDDIRDPNVKYPNQKKNGRLRCNTIGKNPSDVWEIAKVTSGRNRSSIERMPHPAQYPEDLIYRIILGFTNPKEIILDPFMGSGTTAKVAMLNDRKFVGFELREDYCNTIKVRLEQTLNQMEIEKAKLTLF